MEQRPPLTHAMTSPTLNPHPHFPAPKLDTEDDTSSEPPEAITPTSDAHSPNFEHHGPTLTQPSSFPNNPTIITSAPTPPLKQRAMPTHPAPTAATPDNGPEKKEKRSVAKTIRNVFKRAGSSHAVEAMQRPHGTFGQWDFDGAASSTAFLGRGTQSANVSPAHSGSPSPATSGSPTSTVTDSTGIVDHTSDPGTDAPSQLSADRRAATGLSLRGRKIAFAGSPHQRKRSRTDAKNAAAVQQERNSNLADVAQLNEADEGFLSPATGVGLKARRMSMQLPDDFVVDYVELDTEFASASKLPLRRGKTLGKGATSTVKLMTRKGVAAVKGGEPRIFAVKEFRKREAGEDQDEYDKKVKSEYSIAHALHHPNIVESIRLCTHAGRWNVVMEYCPQGELFSLVQKGYLQLEDKLCLWKQLLRGVDYLHAHGVAHRDIKLENLLMTDGGVLKITDFGVSEVFSGEHPGLRKGGGECGKNMGDVRRCEPGICGSLPYIAPEVLAKNGMTSPAAGTALACSVRHADSEL